MATGKDADVVIVGAGIFGLACAWSCLREGLRVIVADRNGPGAGASGGLVGALSPHVPDRWNPKKQFQFEALAAAEAYWASVERTAGRRTGFGRVGRLMPIADAAARGRAEERAADAAANWRGAGEWRVREGAEFAGWLAPDTAPFGVIHETLSARIRPGGAVAALADAVVALGGELRAGWEVTGLSPGCAEGPRGRLGGEAVIVAAGAGGFAMLAPFLGPGAGSGEKGQAMALRGAPGNVPLISAHGVFVVAHDDGTVAVGSTAEAEWTDATATDGQLDTLRGRAERLCPALRGAAEIGRWAGLRPKARRRDPMLGPVPGCDGVFVANGGFKIGFGLAPKVGEALAALVQGREAHLPPTFAPAYHADSA
ncbi:MAG: NAD(P)/FAD-dependent oxidoreductase [Paracoccaceae bacterium]